MRRQNIARTSYLSWKDQVNINHSSKNKCIQQNNTRHKGEAGYPKPLLKAHQLPTNDIKLPTDLAALHYAAACGNATQVEYLLSRQDIDPNSIPLGHKSSALFVAAKKNQARVLETLLRHPRITANAIETGQAAHNAAKFNAGNALRILVAHGCNLLVLNDAGSSLLEYLNDKDCPLDARDLKLLVEHELRQRYIDEPAIRHHVLKIALKHGFTDTITHLQSLGANICDDTTKCENKPAHTTTVTETNARRLLLDVAAQGNTEQLTWLCNHTICANAVSKDPSILYLMHEAAVLSRVQQKAITESPMEQAIIEMSSHFGHMSYLFGYATSENNREHIKALLLTNSGKVHHETIWNVLEHAINHGNIKLASLIVVYASYHNNALPETRRPLIQKLAKSKGLKDELYNLVASERNSDLKKILATQVCEHSPNSLLAQVCWQPRYRFSNTSINKGVNKKFRSLKQELDKTEVVVATVLDQPAFDYVAVPLESPPPELVQGTIITELATAPEGSYTMTTDGVVVGQIIESETIQEKHQASLPAMASAGRGAGASYSNATAIAQSRNALHTTATTKPATVQAAPMQSHKTRANNQQSETETQALARLRKVLAEAPDAPSTAPQPAQREAEDERSSPVALLC